MPNWNESMQQTYEYYVVDPITWTDETRLDTVRSSTITWDLSTDTLGTATIDADSDLGEKYVRIYLVTIQNGVKERTVLGTFLVQTPSTEFDGKISKVSMDAYSPLIELKDQYPPFGYTIPKDAVTMNVVGPACEENVRAPVILANDSATMFKDYSADPSETWLSFLQSALSNAKYQFSVDEMGRILFSPIQQINALQPVWFYDDDNSSILQPRLSIDRDLYGMPNVAEVLYSDSGLMYYSRVVNDDENSPTSTVNRGREVVHRVVNPDFDGQPTQEQIEAYTKQLLISLSSLEYTVSYTHAYCPVRIGDCVMLNYVRGGISNVRAKVISQSIQCKTGCQVSETAIFTQTLWGG